MPQIILLLVILISIGGCLPKEVKEEVSVSLSKDDCIDKIRYTSRRNVYIEMDMKNFASGITYDPYDDENNPIRYPSKRQKLRYFSFMCQSYKSTSGIEFWTGEYGLGYAVQSKWVGIIETITKYTLLLLLPILGMFWIYKKSVKSRNEKIKSEILEKYKSEAHKAEKLSVTKTQKEQDSNEFYDYLNNRAMNLDATEIENSINTNEEDVTFSFVFKRHSYTYNCGCSYINVTVKQKDTSDRDRHRIIMAKVSDLNKSEFVSLVLDDIKSIINQAELIASKASHM